MLDMTEYADTTEDEPSCSSYNRANEKWYTSQGTLPFYSLT